MCAKDMKNGNTKNKGFPDATSWQTEDEGMVDESKNVCALIRRIKL
jgi:hypothetical protein